VTRGRFEDSDALPCVNSIMQNAACLIGFQMVKAGKECPESPKVCRDLRCVNRVPKEMDTIRGQRLQIMKFCGVRVFVGQENFGWTPSVHFEIVHEGWPGSAGPRAQVHDALGTTFFQAFSQQLRDRLIGIGDLQDHLQRVNELIAEELRKPWLLVNLEESQSGSHLLPGVWGIF
jgi:hypothetical protein